MQFTAADAWDVLPAAWRTMMAGHERVPVTSGMSGAIVFRLHGGEAGEHYLKIGIGAQADQVRREAERTRWLGSMGIRVPVVAMQCDRPDAFAMTMTALDGEPAERVGPAGGPAVIGAIAHAFAQLHALPVESCRFDETLDVRLARARDLVRRGAIDGTQFDGRNLGTAPADLFARLSADPPPRQDCVVVHGDATLANLIFGHDRTIGFIDCGNCGRSDRYVDLAPLVGEIADRFGAAARDVFLETYGAIRWDRDKARYYSDLYELF